MSFKVYYLIVYLLIDMNKCIASKNVAVIGAGAAGLISAKLFIENGFDLCIYEKSDRIGGVWNCDRMGPMYDSIKTNLPVEVMEINEGFPFPPKEDSSYVGHKEVLNYLEIFTKKNNLNKITRLSHEVNSIDYLNSKWHIEFNCNNCIKTETHDYVVVCNGHYNTPYSPTYEGIINFKGKIFHSKDYCKFNLSEFIDKSILVIGARSSANDIARELAHVCKNIYISDRNLEKGPIGYGKLQHCTSFSYISGDGSFVFSDGLVVKEIDILFYCTGYVYDYPFMKTSNQSLNYFSRQENEIIQSNLDQLIIDKGRAVLNLYQHVFLNENPTLAFVGIPWAIAPFHLFYLQALWIINIFSNKSSLPSLLDRNQWIVNHINQLKETGASPDKFHYLGDKQWGYLRYLSSEAGVFDRKQDLYINMNEEIYNDNKLSAPKYPGADDTYRSRKYIVDRDSGTWDVSKFSN